MGAGAIQPVITEFTQTKRLRADKLEAYALEAAQQCEVLTIPRIAEEIDLKPLLANWRTTQGLRRLLFADESAPSGSPADTIGWLHGLPVGILVGPEGGFSDAERELLLMQDFVIPISLGPRILRADTAAVAALSLVQAIIGDWR
jgi:16S rRNA (uracil1498-N3)-methyltransferase